MRRAVAVLAAAVLLTLAGCGSLADPLPVTYPGSSPAPVVEVAVPTTVRIPAIEVSSSLTHTGMDDATLELEAPPVTEPMQASWFDESGRPGTAGYPAVILGHVSGRPAGATHSVPGVFAKLGELKAGDEILVDRTDGSTARFVVAELRRYCKDAQQQREGCKDPLFDEAAVYGDTDEPTLRAITCGGLYDAAEHSYRSNIVVFATLA